MDNPKSSNISISSMLRHYESQLTQLQHEVTILTTQNKDYLNTIKVSNFIAVSWYCLPI